MSYDDWKLQTPPEYEEALPDGMGCGLCGASGGEVITYHHPTQGKKRGLVCDQCSEALNHCGLLP